MAQASGRFGGLRRWLTQSLPGSVRSASVDHIVLTQAIGSGD